MENSSTTNDQSFWQFSDQLRLQTSALASLSIGGSDNIWGDAFLSKNRRPEDRRNFNINTANTNDDNSPPSLLGNPDHLFGSEQQQPKQKQTAPPLLSDFNNGAGNGNNAFGWKYGSKSAFTTTNGNGGVGYFNKEVTQPAGGYFNKDVSRPYSRRNQNYNDDFHGKSGGGKKKSSNGNNSSNNNNNNDKAADKRFKTLPASEALPRNEAVGGYIFVCNNDTMPENLQRQLFGLPPRYRDSVRAITPGLPLFLYNYSTHQLHGIFQAASFGGTNIDPSAWEEKKCPGESRFPAQVRAATRKNCEPLEEDSFRPILHHYDGPKFRLELSVPEALALLDKFEEKSA